MRVPSTHREDEEGFLGMASHATLEVLPSRDIKVRTRLHYWVTKHAGPSTACGHR